MEEVGFSSDECCPEVDKGQLVLTKHDDSEYQAILSAGTLASAMDSGGQVEAKYYNTKELVYLLPSSPVLRDSKIHLNYCTNLFWSSQLVQMKLMNEKKRPNLSSVAL